MTYTTPTPSTVSNGDKFQASSYNTISADLQDHESRIATIESDLTTTTNTGTIAVGGYTDITFPTGFDFVEMRFSTCETANGATNYLQAQFLNGSTPYSAALYDYSYPVGQTTNQPNGFFAVDMYAIVAGVYTSIEDFLFDLRSNATHYPNWKSTGTQFHATITTNRASAAQYKSTSATVTGIRVTNASGTYPVNYEYVTRGVS